MPTRGNPGNQVSYILDDADKSWINVVYIIFPACLFICKLGGEWNIEMDLSVPARREHLL